MVRLNCMEAKRMAELAKDMLLSAEENQQLHDHLQGCPECTQYYDQLSMIVDMLHAMPEEEAPSLSAGVMDAVRTLPKPRRSMGRVWKPLAAVAACVVLVFAVGALNNRNSNVQMKSSDQAPMVMYIEKENAKMEELAYLENATTGAAMDMAGTYDGADVPMADSVPEAMLYGDSGAERGTGESSLPTTNASTPQSGNKIIKYGSLELASTRFDEDFTRIQSMLASMGAYVENSSMNASYEGSSRSAYLTIRVPQEQYANLTQQLLTVGQLRYQSESGQDITGQYTDTEAHLKNLQLQESRIQELLGKAETLSDVLQLESELTRIRYQIESMEGTLKSWDNLVNYSTLNVNLMEVEAYKPIQVTNPTFLQRMLTALQDGWENAVDILEGFILFVVSLLPVLIVLAILIIVIVWLVRKRKH